jgi:hypothetical protein
MPAWRVGVIFGLLIVAPSAFAGEASVEARKILAARCYACHGPDGAARQADLRLDDRAEMLKERASGRPAVVPGDVDASELIRRVTHADPVERMPPAEMGPALSEHEITVLREWIAEGAPWPRHWSHEPVMRTAPPFSSKPWSKGAIDEFLLAKMPQGLSPSPPASREALLRRVTLQLTGIPPSLEELDAFLADERPDAYERVVDRLLASPRFGERMALAWLDLARYADTHGYHADTQRDMWRYRDWVIEAFNQNMPFDRFTTEQLAGDLLPGATLSQRIASGFNRNHMINFENGIFADEYRAEYVHDRVATTATVWLGQTIGCARCHDHKYEPFTQRDYYGLFAYFNNVPENGVDGRDGNAAPMVKAPTRLQQARENVLRGRIAAVEDAMRKRASESASDQAAWEKRLLAGGAATAPPNDAAVHLSFDGEANLPGKFGQAMLFDGETHLPAPGDAPPSLVRFTISAWVFPTTLDDAAIADVRGAEFGLAAGRLRFRVESKGAVELETVDPLPLREWRHVAVVCDDSASSAIVRLFVDGKACAAHKPEESITEDQPPTNTSKQWRIGDRFRGLIDEVRLFARPLDETEIGLLGGEDRVRLVASIPLEKRSPAEAQSLQKYYLENVDPQHGELVTAHRELARELDELVSQFPTTMVMAEMSPPRETHVLVRGDYKTLGEKVTPSPPTWLHAAPADLPPNRLGLARWLSDPRHPLTARVAVNRFWQLFFASGLAPTADDLGLRGEPPTHPELLDWLAAEFIDSGWDMKELVRTIVTSAAYRQANFPHRRLEAELVRDVALASAGMLQERLGGPSVFPYQPPGLWEELSVHPTDYTAQVYKTSRGADLYRRGLYTFWKRSAPPPALMALDAPDREVCTAQRQTSNTPLAALVLMNDPVLVEAARGLAERAIGAASDSASRIAIAFRLATSRSPSSEELAILREMYDAQLNEYRVSPALAKELLAVGEWPAPAELDPPELAAMSVVASAILCLDETISVP